MARLQLGRQLGDEDIASITAFLKTLTGQQPSFALPILPPSNNATPRPKPSSRALGGCRLLRWLRAAGC
ncbi:hypothetical protein ULG90_20640 [Halopseudomonas pachastrellae]|nr:hypothetical protein ULG90_20640 [Halopseudomonas pachastrellae]